VPRTRLRTEIRQDQLVEAALAVMAEQGRGSLSVAAVARRAGLAPSAIYRHFPGKQALLDAVVERMRERMLGAVAAARAAEPDAIAALRRVHERLLHLVRQNRALPRVVLSGDYPVGDRARRERMLDLLTRFLDALAGIVADGQRRGRIRSDVNARSLAVLFLGLFQPAAVLWAMSDGRFDVTRQAREAWPVFEQALRAPGGARAPRRGRPARRLPRPRRSPS